MKSLTVRASMIYVAGGTQPAKPPETCLRKVGSQGKKSKNANNWAASHGQNRCDLQCVDKEITQAVLTASTNQMAAVSVHNANPSKRANRSQSRQRFVRSARIANRLAARVKVTTKAYIRASCAYHK